MQIDVRDYGAQGGGDDSAAFQAAIDACPKGGRLVIAPSPTGRSYQIADVRIPAEKQISIDGCGGTWIGAARECEAMFTVGPSISRFAPLTIQNLFLDGRRVASSAIAFEGGRTNPHLSNLSIRNCSIGLDAAGVLNLHLQDSVIMSCDVGLRVTQKANGGNGGADLFSNVELYSNGIGAVLDGDRNPRWGGLGQNLFVGGAIQNNRHCGIAAFNSTNMQLQGMHFELNGYRGSTTYEGHEIPASNLYLNRAECNASNVLWSGDRDTIKAENNSRVSFAGRQYQGGAFGHFVNDLDGTTTVDASGSLSVGGATNCRWDGPWRLADVNQRFCWVSSPTINYSPTVPNIAPDGTLPVFTHPAGIVSHGRIEDTELGSVYQATFVSETGTTQRNRVVLDPITGAIGRGDCLLIQLLVKGNKNSVVMFDLANSLAAYPMSVNDEWQKLNMAVKAVNPVHPRFFVYPKDDAGAEVRISHLQTMKSTRVSDFAHVMHNNLYGV